MYTAAQIVARACSICKVPGFTAQAGQYLNMILADLCQTYDFDFIRETTMLQLLGGVKSYALPEDHLRTREVFYNVNGTIFYLNQIPMDSYDQLFIGPGVDNYPEQFAVQMETDPNTMYFWPPPEIPLSVTVRYQGQQADIDTPETSSTIPWFPNQRYLITKLSSDLMTETDDDRAMVYDKKAEGILRQFLEMKDDKENYAQQVRLDGRLFRNSGGLKPTKQTSIW